MSRQELELGDLAVALWKKAGWLVLAAAVAGALGFWRESGRPSVHQATAFLEIGRIDQELIEEPHLLAEVVNAPGFLASRHGDEANSPDAPDSDSGDKKKKKRRGGGGGGRISAECLETGRKRERIVYLVRLASDGEDKAAVRNTVEAAAAAVLERHKKPFDEAVALYKNRETELTNRLDALRKSNGGLSEIAQCERELFDVRTKLTAQRTYPTRLALDITAPEVVSSPNPKKGALVAAAAAFLLAALAVVGYEFVRPLSRPGNGEPVPGSASPEPSEPKS